MPDKKIQSLQEVNLKEIEMPIIAVYKSPEDYPGYCVARICDTDKPTDTVMVKKTIAEIEMDIHRNMNMTFVPRGAEDVASLVGIWW